MDHLDHTRHSLGGCSKLDQTEGLARQITTLKDGDHLCLIYEKDPVEQMPILSPYIQQGLGQGERCFYIADDQTVEQVRGGLLKTGIDVDEASKQGKLLLLTRKEWRQPGKLNSRKKSDQVRAFIDDAFHDGFKGVRFAIEMTWTLTPDIKTESLEHWEATINEIFNRSFPGRIICQYNRSRLTPYTIKAALKTHPLAILDRDICPNMFYEAPLILNQSSESERLEWMISRLKSTCQIHIEREREVWDEAQSEEIKNSQTKIDSILNSMHDVYFKVDQNWRFISANSEFLKLLKKKEEDELIGESLWEVLPETIEDDTCARLHRAMREQLPVSFNTRYLVAGFSFELNIFPGEGGCLSVFAKDFTRRKSAEEALGATEEQMRILTSLAGLGVCRFNEKGCVTFYSYLAELFGCEPKLNESFQTFLNPFRMKRADGAVLQYSETPFALALQQGKFFRNVELLIERPSGSKIHFTTSVEPLFDLRGKQCGAIALFQNIRNEMVTI
jgi:PAS domain-containing protein